MTLLSGVLSLLASKKSRTRQSSAPEPVLAHDLYHRLMVSMAPPILDVRDADRYLSRRIPGSVYAPESDTKGLLQRVRGLDRFVLVCDNGRLSAMVARTLKFCGFHGVRYLQGGLAAWSAAGGILVETTPSGVERPLARYRESNSRRLLYSIAASFSARLVLIALAASAFLLTGFMMAIR